MPLWKGKVSIWKLKIWCNIWIIFLNIYIYIIAFFTYQYPRYNKFAKNNCYSILFEIICLYKILLAYFQIISCQLVEDVWRWHCHYHHDTAVYFLVSTAASLILFSKSIIADIITAILMKLVYSYLLTIVQYMLIEI